MDYIFVLIGFLGSVATGTGWPVMTILFGNVVDVFVDFEVAYGNATANGQPTDDLVHEFMRQIYLLSGLLLVVMAVFVLGNYANIHCFQMFSLRQMSKIKKRYFASILKQEVAWYDRQSSGEFASRISSDFKKFESGINENLGLLIYNVTGGVVRMLSSVLFVFILLCLNMIFDKFTFIGKLDSWSSLRVEAFPGNHRHGAHHRCKFLSYDPSKPGLQLNLNLLYNFTDSVFPTLASISVHSTGT